MRALARRHGIHQKTVAKWKKRKSTADRRTGPTLTGSTVLSVEQEAILVVFRKHMLLPLDDCLYALQATSAQLTRSSLPHGRERHGISRLPEVEGDKPRRKTFDTYPIGFCHVDLAEVRTAEASSTCSWPALKYEKQRQHLEVRCRLTKPNHPRFLNNGPTGRSSMNRNQQGRDGQAIRLRHPHPTRAYNFARRLKNAQRPHATNLSANSGHKPQTDLLPTQSVKCRR